MVSFSPNTSPFDVLINVVLREGYDKIRVQSLPTRAPEVWRGLGCWHSSDVWSLGVTVSFNLSISTSANQESWHTGWLHLPFLGRKTRLSKGLLKHGALRKYDV